MTDLTVHHAYGGAHRALGCSYTDGLTDVGHPEFVIYTADNATHAERIFAAFADFVVQRGHTFQHGDALPHLLGGFETALVRLAEVRDTEHALPATFWRHRPVPVRALQVVYTVEGLWPWDDGFPLDFPNLYGAPVVESRSYYLTRDGILPA